MRPKCKGDGVLSKISPRLTYANVMSTLAVFIALGGSSYAAIKIDGSSIKNRSIGGKKLKRNSIAAREIRESRLHVRSATNANRVGGLTADDLKVRCPPDTFPAADVCVERTPRPPAPYSSAVLMCAGVGTPAGPGRRLPTHGELRVAIAGPGLAPGGELTSQVYTDPNQPGQLNILYVTDSVGSAALTPNTAAGGKAYRCVADPLN
jgi:hypothetical protein